jgi:hypothetical protein
MTILVRSKHTLAAFLTVLVLLGTFSTLSVDANWWQKRCAHWSWRRRRYRLSDSKAPKSTAPSSVLQTPLRVPINRAGGRVGTFLIDSAFFQADRLRRT